MVSYWDWSLDWEKPSESIVWDTELGFGGNGDSADENQRLGGGTCVRNGPFANLNLTWLDQSYYPHCLLRGFRSDLGPGKFTGHPFRPDAIKELMEQDNYVSFLTFLETQPHNAIPHGVRGDFAAATAPNGEYCFRRSDLNFHVSTR